MQQFSPEGRVVAPALDAPELGLSEELWRALGAWQSPQDWARTRPKLTPQGAALFERVRAELPDRYDLVDDWRRDRRVRSGDG